jgi:hypothetical protein
MAMRMDLAGASPLPTAAPHELSRFAADSASSAVRQVHRHAVSAISIAPVCAKPDAPPLRLPRNCLAITWQLPGHHQVVAWEPIAVVARSPIARIDARAGSFSVQPSSLPS